MKVMCITDDKWDEGYGPEYGDNDEVIDEMERWGHLFYELQRFPGTMYQASKFIPLDGPDETELVNEEWADKIFELVNK